MSSSTGKTVPVPTGLPFTYDENLAAEPKEPGYADTMDEGERVKIWARIYSALGLSGSDCQLYYEQVHIDFIKNGTSKERVFANRSVTVGGKSISMKPITIAWPNYRQFADAEYTYHKIMCNEKFKNLLHEQMRRYNAPDTVTGTVCFDYSTRVTGLTQQQMLFATSVGAKRINIANLTRTKPTANIQSPVVPIDHHTKSSSRNDIYDIETGY